MLCVGQMIDQLNYVIIYRQENPDIILLNSTSTLNNNIIKIYNYNVIQRNIACNPI